MTDRLYCKEKDVYSIFDFESRQIRFTTDDPHPDGNNLLPPFYVDIDTFYAISNRIRELDKLNSVRAEQEKIRKQREEAQQFMNRWEIP